ncbi:hypothetical protein AAFF_G00395640 [Aldrovandia affinis]|uniref:Uncharacterized protein n=1 Tax=Aldrovandia affinis TaxID=143900 RepID=A0AAD7WKW9_9TELE|nr:hypothetical protein AAFF_G00395640 [Aldrovandia affinis]
MIEGAFWCISPSSTSSLPFGYLRPPAHVHGYPTTFLRSLEDAEVPVDKILT